MLTYDPKKRPDINEICKELEFKIESNLKIKNNITYKPRYIYD